MFFRSLHRLTKIKFSIFSFSPFFSSKLFRSVCVTIILNWSNKTNNIFIVNKWNSNTINPIYQNNWISFARMGLDTGVHLKKKKKIQIAFCNSQKKSNHKQTQISNHHTNLFAWIQPTVRCSSKYFPLYLPHILYFFFF